MMCCFYFLFKNTLSFNNIVKKCVGIY
uniref:Uncharacterized protein n=1 Tax=Anguilla anguilla TaxID=7936 RepID=A0A0E9QAL7_ANGAN